MNNIILMGNLGKDPEIRYSQDGKAVASFSLAVRRTYSQNGEYATDWFNCVCFGTKATFVEKYIKKGTKVVVSGEMQNNNYTNKDGQMVYGFQVAVNQIEFAESKNNQQGNQQNVEPQNEPAKDDFLQIPDNVDTMLPF